MHKSHLSVPPSPRVYSAPTTPISLYPPQPYNSINTGSDVPSSPCLPHPATGASSEPSLLDELLEGGTQPPISLPVFRDRYLQIYDPSGRLASLMQFHAWVNTYVAYFSSLTEEEQRRAPPPSPKDFDDARAGLAGSSFVEQLAVGGLDLPFRTELDCALAHYMTRVPLELRNATLSVSRRTTHPDILVPALKHTRDELAPAALAFLTDSTYNIAPRPRAIRGMVAVLAIVMGLGVAVACITMNVTRYWRIVPLPWISAAWIYLVCVGVYGLEPARYWWGLAEAGVAMAYAERREASSFSNVFGKSEAEPGTRAAAAVRRLVMVQDDWVLQAQKTRWRRAMTLAVVGILVLWGAIFAIPNLH